MLILSAALPNVRFCGKKDKDVGSSFYKKETFMKRSVREKFFRQDLQRYSGLWVCQPEPAVKTIVASGDSQDEAIGRAVALGTDEPFAYFVPPEIKGGNHEREQRAD